MGLEGRRCEKTQVGRGSSENYEGWEVVRRECDGNGVGTRENREGRCKNGGWEGGKGRKMVRGEQWGGGVRGGREGEGGGVRGSEGGGYNSDILLGGDVPFFQQEQHASVIFHSELFAFRVWALTRLRFSKLPGKGRGTSIGGREKEQKEY
jgi:hypothetical protein